MNLTWLLPWVTFIHVLAVFVFVAGHGVTIGVAFRLRSERDPQRMLALLDLSKAALVIAGVGMVIVLAAGIASGVIGGYFSTGWIWLSLVLFVGIGLVMTPLGAGYFGNIRRGLGQRTRQMKATDPDPTPLPSDQIVALVGARRPEALALIGGGGFAVILYLMMFKPF